MPSVAITSGGRRVEVAPKTETEWFAPSRFEVLGHEEALTRPSFERMKGLVLVDGGAVRAADPVVVDPQAWSDTISTADGSGGFRLTRPVRAANP